MDNTERTIRVPLDENSEQWEIDAVADIADLELSGDIDKMN